MGHSDLSAVAQFHRTFGKSGHTNSQRSCRPYASRLGQSPLSCSRHFIMFALRPYFSMSLRTLSPLPGVHAHGVGSCRNSATVPSNCQVYGAWRQEGGDA